MWLWQYIKSSGDNFGKINSKLYRGAKPDNYPELARRGITKVINLIDGDQTEEQKRVERVHLDFVHIPMSDKEVPGTYTQKALVAALFSDGVKFVHCKGGRHRTGLAIAMYRVLADGWSKKEAWKEAEKYGWYGALGHEPLKRYFFEFFNPNDFEDLK